MKIFSAAMLVCCLMAGLALPAAASVDDGAEIDASITLPLMAWVQYYTGVRVPMLPRVVASHTLLEKTAAGLKDQTADHRSVAAYLPGVIIIDDRDWDPNDPIQLSILVHELVHHDQRYMKTDATCHEAMEKQAYSLQNKWLMDRGLEPFNGDNPDERILICPGAEPQGGRSVKP